MAKVKEETTRAVGRRKTASARIRLVPGKGSIIINNKDYKVYFPITFWQEKVTAPLEKSGNVGRFDISVRVAGGGVNAQSEAVRHGISRALVAYDAGFKPVLKAEGYMTRDARARERKKPGKRTSRRGHQWRKR